MAQQNLRIHPRETLPHTAPHVLESNPKIDLQLGRFFITRRSSIFKLMLFVFSFGKYKRLQSLLKKITIT